MPALLLCPTCRSATKTMANTFYGTGLSVHKNIALCPQCNWVGFAARDDEPVEVAAPSDRPTTWLERFASSFLRLGSH